MDKASGMFSKIDGTQICASVEFKINLLLLESIVLPTETCASYIKATTYSPAKMFEAGSDHMTNEKVLRRADVERL